MLVEVTYRITKELQKELLIETGKDGSNSRTEEIDLDTKELRSAWVSLFGLKTKANITHMSYQDYIEAKHKGFETEFKTFRFELPSASEKVLSTDEIKSMIVTGATDFEKALAQSERETAEEKVEYEAKMEVAIPFIKRIETAKATGDLDALRAENLVIPDEIQEFCPRSSPYRMDYMRQDAFRHVSNAQGNARREEEKAAREEEKARWIKAHGSERLRLAFEEGYEIGRIYTLERAEYEYPDWDIDYKDGASWNERKNPTLVELHVAEKAAAETGHRVTIVWLTSPPSLSKAVEYDEWDEDEFDQCAALVIEDYLGKYTLVKSL